MKWNARWRGVGRWSIWFVVTGLVLGAAWPRAEWRLLSSRLINSQAVERLGLGGYFVFDLVDTTKRMWKRSRLAKVDVQPYREFLRSHTARVRNPVRPAPTKQKHVVYLQLESIDGLMIGGRKNGQSTMPYLESLAEKHVYFTNVLDCTATGRTTDGEFLVLTSQVPVARPPVYVSQQLDRIPSLPRVLNEAGYHTQSMHGFNGVFWHRAEAHAALGYDEMSFEDDLDLAEKIGWGWSDAAVLQAAADRLIASEEPAFLHVITLTNHHPYDYIAQHQGEEPGTIEEEFLRSVAYVDDAIKGFMERLDSAGVLDDCLIVIYSDHDSAIDVEMEAHLDSFYPRLISDTVPLIMIGFDRAPQRVDAIVGLQDVPVMVLEELGIPAPLTFLGNGWDKWGRTYSASHAGWQMAGDVVAPWGWPVDAETLTRLAINYPEKLLEP
ncbi:MAG: LTA synthase family protein [Opitutaceae bacterium]|nr:LTA synthase family protein [Opitutaceae bacterium]